MLLLFISDNFVKPFTHGILCTKHVPDAFIQSFFVTSPCLSEGKYNEKKHAGQW